MTDNSNLLFIIISFALFIITLLALQCYYFFRVKPQKDGSIFTVTKESIGEQSDKIKSVLSQMHMKSSEMTNALLLLEEIVVRLQENADQIVTAYVHNIFGKVSLSLIARGQKYNPLEEKENSESESEDFFRNLIFKANSVKLFYKRRGSKNIVTVRVH